MTLASHLSQYEIGIRVCQRLRERFSDPDLLHPSDLNHLIEGTSQIIQVLRRYQQKVKAEAKAHKRPQSRIYSFADFRMNSPDGS